MAQIETHVISSIVHIAHEYDDDSSPWPIEIENHRTGELVGVNLEPGQVKIFDTMFHSLIEDRCYFTKVQSVYTDA